MKTVKFTREVSYELEPGESVLIRHLNRVGNPIGRDREVTYEQVLAEDVAHTKTLKRLGWITVIGLIVAVAAVYYVRSNYSISISGQLFYNGVKW